MTEEEEREIRATAYLKERMCEPDAWRLVTLLSHIDAQAAEIERLSRDHVDKARAWDTLIASDTRRDEKLERITALAREMAEALDIVSGWMSISGRCAPWCIPNPCSCGRQRAWATLCSACGKARAAGLIGEKDE